ncbi:MAG: tetratricopeptide repeat protein [Candidatus Niyogibacteria bacterium]|nr:tetratricopeptide repeat protein [Candidatus Niyogibacteria bacterium]
MTEENVSISIEQEAMAKSSAVDSEKAGGPPTGQAGMLDSIYNKVARIIFYVLAFLLPLWVLPVTPFPLDANKAYLAYFLVLVAFIAWLIGRVKEGVLVLPKSVILASFGLLVLVWGIAAIFSQSPHFSFMAFGHETGTFVTVLVAAVAAFMVALIFQDASFVLRWIMVLFGSAAVVFLFQLAHIVFGSSLWMGDIFNSPTSNLLGGWNSFGVFAGLIAFLALAFLEIIRPKKIKSFLIAMLAVAFLALAIVNFSTLWWILAVLLIIFISYLFVLRGGSYSFAGPTLLIICLVLFFILAQQLASSLVSYAGISFLEVRPSWSATIDVVKQSLAANMITGSGPNTFVYDWLRYKPVSINETLFWNVRFASGMGHVISWAASAGILGIFAFIMFLSAFLWQGYRAIAAMKNTSEYHLLIVTFFASAYLWLVNIFYTPNFILFLFAFIFSGLFVAMSVSLGIIGHSRAASFQNSASGFVSVMLIIFALIFSISSIYYFAQKYVALWSFGSGLAYSREGNMDAAENAILRAVKYDVRDEYLRALADINLARIQQLLSNKDVPSNELTTRFQGLLSNAINYGQEAVKINAADSLNWMEVGRVYEAVIPFKVAGASDAANKMYDEAATRNPLSPEIVLAKARVAIQASKLDDARKLLSRAVELKSDYTPARYLLVQLAVEEGKIDEALSQAEAARILDPNDMGLLFQLGLLYYQKDKMADAGAAFEKIVSLNPDYANALYFLGLTYDRQGKKDKAIEQFEHILKLNSGNAEILKIIQNLRAGKPALSNISPPAPAPENRKGPPVE